MTPRPSSPITKGIPGILILLLGIASLHAESTNLLPSQPITSFEECLKHALASNPALLKTREDLASSRLRLYQAYANLAPVANASGGFTRLNQEPPRVDLASLMGPDPPKLFGNPLLQYPYQDSWNGQIRISFPLMTGGRNVAGILLSRADFSLHQSLERNLIAQIKADLVKAFFGVAVNGKMCELASETMRQLDRKVLQMSNLVKAGSATELELMRTRVLRATWSSKYAGMIRDYEANLNRLAALTGIAKEKLHLTDSDIRIGTLKTESLEEARKRALLMRPESSIAISSLEIAKATRIIKRSSLLPQASVSWNAYWSQGKEEASLSRDDWTTWWDLRLVATWDIFNLPKLTEHFQAQHDSRAKEDEQRMVLDRILLEAEDAFRGLDVARKSLEAAEQNLQLAHLTAEHARSRKENGTITETEELESALGETEAQVQKMKAQYDLAVAAAEYARATGLTE